LVVNEPGLAEAINRLRGEWAEKGAGELSASASDWAQVATLKAIDADVVIFPARYMGELSVREMLRPVRPNVLESDALNTGDYFPLVRQELMKWGGQEMALPLGVRLVAPTDPIEAHPGLSLLARAAPQAVSRDRLGVLFDAETMKPRITEPAFVEALAGAATKNASNDPDAVSVPVFGHADRMAAVTSSTRNAASAFKLLEWLATAEISTQLAAAGDGTLPVRRSLATSAKWYGEQSNADERSQLAATLGETLSSERFLIVPRIPGVDDYMAALDDAVTSVTDDGISPQDALEKAARRWEEITETRGREGQRAAYMKHLGI
jgi:hypothetical protein